jgi:hypothetical protein
MLGDGHATKKKKSLTVEMGVSLGTEKKQEIYNFVTNYLSTRKVNYWISRRDDKHTVVIMWTQNKEKLPITFEDIYDEDRNKIIKSVELFDVYGQVQSSNQVNSTKFTLTLNHFSSGYYFLKVLSEGTEQIEKVFISY